MNLAPNGNEISKSIDNKLKDLGFEYNKFAYKYGKQIDDNTYINAYYSKQKSKYIIGGTKKFKSPLGENSIGISFQFDNENDFKNKINEYLSKSSNPEIKYKNGGNIQRHFTYTIGGL
jgi:hypothetical protein